MRVFETRMPETSQRVLGLLERQQHGLLVLRERARGCGVAGRDAGPHTADVEKRPVHTEREEPRLAVALEQGIGVKRLGTEQATQRKTWEQVRCGHADALGD